jgi:hypothetical protein
MNYGRKVASVIKKIYNPNTGKEWCYEISGERYSRKELKALLKEIKKELRSND